MELPLPIPNRVVKRRSADDTLLGKVGSRQFKGFNFALDRNLRRCSTFHRVAVVEANAAHMWHRSKRRRSINERRGEVTQVGDAQTPTVTLSNSKPRKSEAFSFS